MNLSPSVQDISKSSPWIRMKFAEYVEFATRTNQLDFDEDPISGKRIFRAICNDYNVKVIWISELISRTDRGRTNDLSTYNLMFSTSLKYRWWLSVLDVTAVTL